MGPISLRQRFDLWDSWTATALRTEGVMYIIPKKIILELLKQIKDEVEKQHKETLEKIDELIITTTGKRV